MNRHNSSSATPIQPDCPLHVIIIVVCIVAAFSYLAARLGIVPINNAFDAFLGGSVLKSSSIKARVIKEFFAGESNDLADKLRKQLSASLLLR